MIRKTLLAASVLLVMAAGANAAVIVGIAVDPPTTAGGGATSTRSGVGTWQLYMLDQAGGTAGNFGISSYNITMSNTTAINHRSPVTTVSDVNTDPQTAGFNLLRTATNANPIQASQNLPGQTPFLLTGFGYEASSFAAKTSAIDAMSSVIGPTTSGSWGNYPVLANYDTSAFGPGNWLFVAEGAYNAAGGARPGASASVATIYSTENFQSVAAQTQNVELPLIPEPATITLLGLAAVGCLGYIRRRR